MKKIGVVGLGIMGRGIAMNFLKKGYQVYAWNRSVSVVNSLQHAKLISCESPKQVACEADIIFEVTANDESSRAVWLGDQGILHGAKGKIAITSATLSVNWIERLAKRCHEQSVIFLDMPMTGGRVAAESGKLIFLCGGDEQVLKFLKPTLSAIAAKFFYFGKAGQGMRYKLILNFVQSVHVLVFGQAMQLAKSGGMDLKKVAEALVDRPGGVGTTIAATAYFQDPTPLTFSIDWITKDLRYAKEMSKNLKLDLLKVVYKEYLQAVQEGCGNQDWASINTLE